jgi:hypothetical protein
LAELLWSGFLALEVFLGVAVVATFLGVVSLSDELSASFFFCFLWSVEEGFACAFPFLAAYKFSTLRLFCTGLAWALPFVFAFETGDSSSDELSDSPLSSELLSGAGVATSLSVSSSVSPSVSSSLSDSSLSALGGD